MHACVRACMCTCMHVYVCVCMHVCVLAINTMVMLLLAMASTCRLFIVLLLLFKKHVCVHEYCVLASDQF